MAVILGYFRCDRSISIKQSFNVTNDGFFRTLERKRIAIKDRTCAYDS